MARVKVTAYDTDRPIVVEEGATKGATIGTNLYNADGSVLTLEQLTELVAAGVVTPEGAATLWNMITGVPANLVAIAALNLAANTFIARASTGALAAKTISDFALSLVAAADRAAAVAVLDIQAEEVAYDNAVSGLTATDVQGAIDELSNIIGPDTVTALSIASGVVNIDLSLGKFFTLLLTANVTSITFSNLPASGKPGEFAVRIRQDGTGGWTVALPSSFKPTGGSDTSVASAANAYTLLTALTFDQGTRFEYAMQEIAA